MVLKPRLPGIRLVTCLVVKIHITCVSFCHIRALRSEVTAAVLVSQGVYKIQYSVGIFFLFLSLVLQEYWALTENRLSYDVSVIQWITSCHK